jgi:haloacetate dehalogenase
MEDLFEGYSSIRLRTARGQLYARFGGSGPPLLLLHGFPQTHMMWHKIAGKLRERYTVIVPDLPGYGRSYIPDFDDDHRSYTKRSMGLDIVDAMTDLGFPEFSIVGHDRGGRVAYRLALDHPLKVHKLVMLDIVPTAMMWRSMDADLAHRDYHWLFLAQPHPLPEQLICKNVAWFVEYTLASWTGTLDLSAFDPICLNAYIEAWQEPTRIRAACEDYRAGFDLDRKHDEDSLAHHKKITCPTLLLYGELFGTGGKEQDLEKVWRKFCTDLRVVGLSCGHFLPEEEPERCSDEILSFLAEV